MRLRCSLVLLASSAVGVATAVSSAQVTTRESVDSKGFEGDGGARSPAISDDGRWIVFSSGSTNLVALDTNGLRDVFLRDRALGLTRRVSVATGGAQASGASSSPSISADGRFVAFSSDASDLVALDANGVPDAFLHDAHTAETERVSLGAGGAQADGRSTGAFVSANGRWVGFSSRATNLIVGDTNGLDDAYVRDRIAATTVRASVGDLGVDGDGESLLGGLSDDGRFVVFQSAATNLVLLDTNGAVDVFVRDLVAGATARVSVGPSLVQADAASFVPRISGDGSMVAFVSSATNLVALDTNGVDDVFVHELSTGATARVSVASSGAQAELASLRCSISDDGRWVAFDGSSASLVAGDVDGWDDVFLHDRATATTTVASVEWGGDSLRAGGENPEVSGDGRWVAFETDPEVDGVVVGDYNGLADVFLVDRALAAPAPAIYCTAKPNSLACVPRIAHSGAPSLGAAGDEFFVTAVDVLSNKFGLFFFGSTQAALAFGGGTLCVKPPLVRTSVQSSLGNAALDCSGTYSFHFTASYAASHAIAAGQTSHGQFWSRDPGFAPPDNVGLTDALTFTFLP